jgi:hypothetical protein
VDFWEKMTHWIESPLKEEFSDNCLPKVNEWIADILAIAQRLTSSCAASSSSSSSATLTKICNAMYVELLMPQKSSLHLQTIVAYE